LPLWIVSGAMFPAGKSSFMTWAQRLNPMSYSVSAVRRALYAGHPPLGTSLASGSAAIELAVLLLFCVVAGGWSVSMCYRRR
jgi:hypothetical protein